MLIGIPQKVDVETPQKIDRNLVFVSLLLGTGTLKLILVKVQPTD